MRAPKGKPSNVVADKSLRQKDRDNIRCTRCLIVLPYFSASSALSNLSRVKSAVDLTLFILFTNNLSTEKGRKNE